MAKRLCKKYGLLSPLYEMGGMRQGCWFCPNAQIKEYAKLKKNYPHLWQELLDFNEHYRKDKSQFVAQGFKYGQTFDQLITEVDNFKEKEVIYTQTTMFDFMESDNEKQSD